MPIINTIISFGAGLLMGFAIIAIPNFMKRHSRKNKYYSNSEMQAVNSYRRNKPASTNEEYSYQPDHF